MEASASAPAAAGSSPGNTSDHAHAALARFGLQGRTCLVTGGSKGIGASIVEEVAALGARVFTCARNTAELEAKLQEWKAKGLDVQGCTADVSKAEEREKLLQQVSEAFGGVLHILVNNVGTNRRKPTLEYSSEDFHFIFQTNLESAYSMSQKAHSLLKASGAGVVVFNSSVAGGPLAARTGSLYAMSKAAMNQLTKYLACEWAKDGIRVNTVAPWYTATDLANQVLKDEAYKRAILDRTPLGRIAEPAEVSGVVAFLCSPAASYVTGQIWEVDGGYSVQGALFAS